MTLIKTELHKDFVMPVKTNRNVALSEQDKKQGCYKAVETLELEAGVPQKVWLEQVAFPCFWSSKSSLTKTKARASSIW